MYRHSDILIVVWDGRPKRSEGDTAHILREAEEAGVPVIRIDSRAPHAVTLLGTLEEPAAQAGLDRRPATFALVERLLSPAARGAGGWGVSESLRLYSRGEALEVSDKRPDWLYEGPLEAARGAPDRVFGWVFRALVSLWAPKTAASDEVGAKPRHGPEAAPPEAGRHATVTRLFLHYLRADQLASRYAMLHRGAFMTVYAFGAVALAAAVGLIYFEEAGLAGPATRSVLIVAEVLALASMLGIVVWDRIGRWKERWLDYRLLAELLREADVLALLGRTLPKRWIEEIERDLVGRRWIAHYLNAVVRSAGVVSRHYDPAFVTACRDYVEAVRVQDQIRYHQENARRCKRVRACLIWISVFFLFLALGALAVKMVSLPFLEAISLGVRATVIPAVAHTLSLIRSQAEFEIIGRRSERVARRLGRRQAAFEALRERPASAERIGDELLRVASILRRDVVNWIGIREGRDSQAE